MKISPPLSISDKFYHKISSFFPKKKFKDLDIQAVESILCYRFRDRELLYTAFKHSSFLPITKEKYYKSNERLEFLGDAVLDLVVTEFLYTSMPKTSEGELSKIKSVLVSRNVLAEIVANLELGNHLLVNRGEEKTGGRTRPSNLANLYEAILAAVYLDGGLKSARSFIEHTLLFRHERLLNHQNFINYKSILLEYIQSLGPGSPIYVLVNESGPDHEKRFIMNVCVGEGEEAQGEGRTKKLAEQATAHNLLKKIAPELISSD
ncbi:MAG: ribonuclease III [Calditrichia bacterium]